MSRQYRPYRAEKYKDTYPLKAKIGIFKWPGGYFTKGPYRKPPKNLVIK